MKLDRLFDSFASYMEDRIALAKVEIGEELSMAMARIALALLFGVIGVMFMVFASLSLAILLGHLLHSLALGLSIVSLCYLLAFLLLAYFRKHLDLEARLGHYIEALLKIKR